MWALLWKDVRLELRTKERLASLFVLALLIVFVFVFALSPERLRSPEVSAALLWVALVFAGMLGLQRAFLVEQERGCLSGVLLCPFDPGAVFLAKFLGNVLSLTLVSVLVTPVTLLSLEVRFSWSLLALPAVVLLGIIGFSAVGTLFAAMAVRTRAREVLLPVMLLPLLTPLLIAAVEVTGAVLAGAAWPGVWVRVLLAFDVIFVITGWLIFSQIVRE
ncbi:MAG: heme exporter protein CcmB [Thermodesulfobacteriota bacterium]|jgi:heme exporter protein B